MVSRKTIDQYPELLAFWDYEKNESVQPSDLSVGSNKKVWWKCLNGHHWCVAPHNMKNNNGCPYCSGTRILSGVNDLLTINPELGDEWDYDANQGIDPHTIGPNSNKKVAWICKKGHRWKAVVSHRNRGVGCPVCSNKLIIPGVNDFATVHPELLPEWNYEKNVGLSPDTVPPSGAKRVWWICSKGHEYQATLNKRHNGTGCPYCYGNKLLTGYNDLQTVYPEIAATWDYEKNGDLRPEMITAHNNKRIWWRCERGHSWQTSVDNRAKGKGCPHCSGRIITSGSNDFSSLHPAIAAEWDYERNTISPDSIGGKSAVYAWWRCQMCGYSWRASVSNRVAGTGCPKCARRTHSSFPEQAVFYYVQKAYPDAINGYKQLFDNQMELDIYVPSLKIAIEYDGKAWHKGSRSREKEIIKFDSCKQAGITLIRIKEKIEIGDEKTCDFLISSQYDYNHYMTLQDVLIELKKYVPLLCDINIERDRNEIWEGFYSALKTNSLRDCYPKIAVEWHPSRNGTVLPQMMTASSTEKVWWQCEKGHEWFARISDRVKGHNCPYCSNKKLLVGYNDLATVHPELAREWDVEKNKGTKASDIITGSGKKYWWKCQQGHSWEAVVYIRVHGCGCPYCSGRYAISGETDLKTLRPDIAVDWDYEKNGTIIPEEWTVGSGKKVWWKCKNGHEKCTRIFERVRSNGCPECRRINNKLQQLS